MSYKPRTVSRAAGLAALVGAGWACGGNDLAAEPDVTVSTASTRLLDAGEFFAYLDDEPSVTLVNVHVPYEGHIDGTDAFVPFDEINDWDELPTRREAPIAVYCRSGSMSAQATDTLAALGYTNIVDLRGGMNAWVAAGNPLLTRSS